MTNTTQNPTIKVKIKTIYGTERIYPACDKAQIFCDLILQNTLTGDDIEKIKKLGYEVQVVSDHPATL